MGEASGAELLHLFSAIYLSAVLAASLPAHKQSEQPQIQATAGVIPANTNALCSSGLSLVAGLTTLPTCTSKETYTTSLGEACSFPPSCKRSRQPAKTSPTKGFPQHLLQRWILAFSVNAATSAPSSLPPPRVCLSPGLGTCHSGCDTLPRKGLGRQQSKKETDFPTVTENPDATHNCCAGHNRADLCCAG